MFLFPFERLIFLFPFFYIFINVPFYIFISILTLELFKYYNLTTTLTWWGCKQLKKVPGNM